MLNFLHFGPSLLFRLLDYIWVKLTRKKTWSGIYVMCLRNVQHVITAFTVSKFNVKYRLDNNQTRIILCFSVRWYLNCRCFLYIMFSFLCYWKWSYSSDFKIYRNKRIQCKHLLNSYMIKLGTNILSVAKFKKT